MYTCKTDYLMDFIDVLMFNGLLSLALDGHYYNHSDHLIPMIGFHIPMIKTFIQSNRVNFPLFSPKGLRKIKLDTYRVSDFLRNDCFYVLVAIQMSFRLNFCNESLAHL